MHDIFTEALPNGVHILTFLFLFWLWPLPHWLGKRWLVSPVSSICLLPGIKRLGWQYDEIESKEWYWHWPLLLTVVYCSLYCRSPGTGRLITGEFLSQVSRVGSGRWELLCWLQLQMIFTSNGQRVLGCRLTQPLTELAEKTPLLWSVVSRAITVIRHILICHDVVLTAHISGKAPLPPPHSPIDLRSLTVLWCHLNIQDESLTSRLV